jgi:hypothetical protein
MARRPVDPSRPVVRPDCSPKLPMSHMSQRFVFKPLNVDARCCDSKTSRQLKRISAQSDNQNTRHGLVGKGRTPSLRSCPICTASFEPHRLFSKERLPVGNRRSFQNHWPRTVNWPASGKKEQLLSQSSVATHAVYLYEGCVLD